MEVKINSEEALKKLKKGNVRYVRNVNNPAMLTKEIRKENKDNGQKPYAIVVSCSDSRVPVEHVFSAGIGELFVVRTAGNVLDDVAMGSVEYGATMLDGCPLILVLGHSCCGAIEAAVKYDEENDYGTIQFVIDKVLKNINGETDCEVAKVNNVLAVIEEIKQNAAISALITKGEIKVVGGTYDIGTGIVIYI